MPINVTCSACNQMVAAPESMAGKKAVCPNCRAVIAIPEQFVPAQVVETEPALEPPSAQVSHHDMPASLDIAKSPDLTLQAENEKAAVRVLRVIYVVLRGDWRRLPTCPHLWLGVILFFLPWVNVSCNSRTIVTQTGLQTCHGAISVEPKFERLARNNRALEQENLPKPRLNELPPWSILSIIYITFTVLGACIGLVCIPCVIFRLSNVAAASHLFSLGLGGAAFLALASQMVIGFPIEKHATQQAQQAKAEHERRNPQQADAFDVAIDIGTNYTGWLWLSFALAFVSVPVFLLEFVILLVDAVHRHMGQRDESG